MAQRGVAGAEIVERDAAAGAAQRADEARRFLDVVERRGLGDLDDEPAGELGLGAQLRDQRPQPRPVGRGQGGDVEAEGDARIGEPPRQPPCRGYSGRSAGYSRAARCRARTRRRGRPRRRRRACAAGTRNNRPPRSAPTTTGWKANRTRSCRSAVWTASPTAVERLLALALLFAGAVVDEAVAAGALGLGERRLGPGDHVVGGRAVRPNRGAADRDGGDNRAARRSTIGAARTAVQDLFRGTRYVLGRAMRQDDAKAVAAQSPDHVADPHAGVEPPADLDQHGIGRRVAEACSLIALILSMPTARNTAGPGARRSAAMMRSTASRSRVRLKWPVSSS